MPTVSARRETCKFMRIIVIFFLQATGIINVTKPSLWHKKVHNTHCGFEKKPATYRTASARYSLAEKEKNTL